MMSDQDEQPGLWTTVNGDAETERFGRYLCSELCWELDRHAEIETPLRGACREDLRVLRFARYEQIELQYQGRRYRARLTWLGDQPPEIDEATDDVSP